MGRPLGSATIEDKLATDDSVRAVCRARFVERFGESWSARWSDELLGDDALSIAGLLMRARSQPDEKARKELTALRSRALAAIKAVRATTSDSEITRVLRRIVKALPDELIEESPRWARPRRAAKRTRVALNAPRVFGRVLTNGELAVVGILAGVRFAMHRGERVNAVLTRERNAYASRRR